MSTTVKTNQKPPTEMAANVPPITGIDSPLKWPAQQDWSKPRKKAKVSKTDSGVTTLTEGDLNDIENTVWDIARDAVDKAMLEQQIVLGELRTELQELGTRIALMSTSATQGVPGMIAAESLLKAQMAHSIMILAGSLITANAEDCTVLGRLKGLGLNVAALPRESLQ